MGRTDLANICSRPRTPPDFYHIYKYIHKYITYNSQSGRQAPHRGMADTCLGNSREGHWAPKYVLVCSLLPRISCAPARPSLPDLVCPVWRVAVGRFGGLRLGLQGAGLAALTRATLGILWKVVVQQLGVGLLVGWQNVQEWWGRIARGRSRGQGPSGAQG